MQSDPIITVENLGKRYQLGAAGKGERYTALRDVVARGARNLLRRGAAADRASGAEDEFWALKDVSFQIGRGEVVGIVGRNGAGKSTLLKVLSRITDPTEGRITLRGRVASLLEVGTGFHPELTGRENIFLNGAILGMHRHEIKAKFDEIVAFSEVERFLDTPVKRYSSGMYVRLAFAVAAHLEPEILVVDEVLAVGDAEFQKKCLGKMSEVAHGGRTVLFVSHNMAAISSLTTRGLVMQAGRLVYNGTSAGALEMYTRSIPRAGGEEEQRWGAGQHTKLRRVRLLDGAGEPVNHYQPGEPLVVETTFDTDGTAPLSLEVFLLDTNRVKLALGSVYQFHGVSLPTEAGAFTCLLKLEPLWLASGNYSLDVSTSVVNHGWDHYVEDAVNFDVISSNPLGFPWDFKHSYGYGALAMLTKEPPRFAPAVRV